MTLGVAKAVLSDMVAVFDKKMSIVCEKVMHTAATRLY